MNHDDQTIAYTYMTLDRVMDDLRSIQTEIWDGGLTMDLYYREKELLEHKETIEEELDRML